MPVNRQKSPATSTEIKYPRRLPNEVRPLPIDLLAELLRTDRATIASGALSGCKAGYQYYAFQGKHYLVRRKSALPRQRHHRFVVLGQNAAWIAYRVFLPAYALPDKPVRVRAVDRLRNGSPPTEMTRSELEEAVSTLFAENQRFRGQYGENRVRPRVTKDHMSTARATLRANGGDYATLIIDNVHVEFNANIWRHGECPP